MKFFTGEWIVNLLKAGFDAKCIKTDFDKVVLDFDGAYVEAHVESFKEDIEAAGLNCGILYRKWTVASLEPSTIDTLIVRMVEASNTAEGQQLNGYIKPESVFDMFSTGNNMFGFSTNYGEPEWFNYCPEQFEQYTVDSIVILARYNDETGCLKIEVLLYISEKD